MFNDFQVPIAKKVMQLSNELLLVKRNGSTFNVGTQRVEQGNGKTQMQHWEMVEPNYGGVCI